MNDMSDAELESLIAYRLRVIKMYADDIERNAVYVSRHEGWLASYRAELARRKERAKREGE